MACCSLGDSSIIESESHGVKYFRPFVHVTPANIPLAKNVAWQSPGE